MSLSHHHRDHGQVRSLYCRPSWAWCGGVKCLNHGTAQRTPSGREECMQLAEMMKPPIRGCRRRRLREPPVRATVSSAQPRSHLRCAACGYRRLLCQSDAATLAIATAAQATQHPKWSCGRDALQAIPLGLWLTSSCLRCTAETGLCPEEALNPMRLARAGQGMRVVLSPLLSPQSEPVLLCRFHSRPASAIPRISTDTCSDL